MKIHDIHLKKKTLDHGLHDVFKLLADDKKLPEKCHDHSLAGDWKDHQDCNIKPASQQASKPDLVLICRKPDESS